MGLRVYAADSIILHSVVVVFASYVASGLCYVRVLYVVCACCAWDLAVDVCSLHYVWSDG